MTHNELRKKYLDFFRDKGHTVVPSDSLVPAHDPTLLFTSAGMNQFKEEFLGNIKGFRRATSCQKCLRTPDLDKVGKTPYHHTFFEMLGNFSFGDYFKKEAIIWAWEFMRDVLKIAENKMWVSVYTEDDEAYNIWKNNVRIQSSKILKLGQKDNFWPSEAKDKGPNGPCGPCSEIFYDYGEGYGCRRPDCSPVCGCGRFVEVWNLVFTQFDRKDKGVLQPLPNKNIDTGMGLERLCAVMQDVISNFETDLFLPIIRAIKDEMPESETDSSSGGMPNIYAIADHIRAAAFAVSDGIAPSNEERGYVIRNILRKAALHGKNLGIDKPFLYKLIFPVSKAMEGPYPELAKRHSDISQVVLAEEERFASTLKNGIPLLKGLIADAKKQGRKILSAEDVFKLSDTYGIPFDVTTEICIEEGFAAPSKEDFEKLLQAQRQQSRKASKMQGAVFVDTGIREATEFVGYEETEAKARAIRMFSSENREIERADKNNGRIFIILDKSVYYGESGGQRGDSGKLCMQGLQVRIYDAKKSRDAILLEGEVLEGELKKGDVVNTVIDKERRLNIARNHTATHILQYALRKVLGEHVKQQGSYVGDGEEGLRFDFCHFKALSKEELARVEEIVNEKIRDNNTVDIAYLEIEEAKKQGALAFFDDKYGQKVRMVSVGDYSKELCGGTHLKTTGQIGNFKIVSESSIASGIRRIEAKTAKAADKIISQEQELISALADLLSCKPNQLLARCEKLLSDFDTLNKRIDGLISKRIAASADDIIKNSQQVADTKLIITKLTDADMEILKKTADIIKGRLKSFVLFLVSVKDEKISLLLSVSDDLVKKGIDAGKLMAELSRLIGGSGGGRPNMALGGAKDVNKLDYLLKEAGVFLRGEIK